MTLDTAMDSHLCYMTPKNLSNNNKKDIDKQDFKIFSCAYEGKYQKEEKIYRIG